VNCYALIRVDLSDFICRTRRRWFYLSLILAVGLFFNSTVFSARAISTFCRFIYWFPVLALAGRQQIGIGKSDLFGYLWLAAGSLWFFVRCLWDLTLVGRPAIGTNLNLAGMPWMVVALFACMVPIAARLPADLQNRRNADDGARTFRQGRHQTVDEVQKHLTGSDNTMNAHAILGRGTIALLCHLAVIAALIVIGAITSKTRSLEWPRHATCCCRTPLTTSDRHIMCSRRRC